MLNYLLEAAPAVEDGALDVPMRGLMKGIDHSEAGLFLDAQMWKLSHAHARLSLRLGEALEPMLKRKGYSALGHARAVDYCREEVGTSKSTADRLARLSLGLKAFPLVHEVFLAGALSECQALLLLAYLPKLGDEAGWVLKARQLTVRGLEQALKQARGRTEGEEVVSLQPPGEARHYRIDPAVTLDWQMAREVAGRLAGTDLKDWQLLEFLAAEFLAGPQPQASEEQIPETPERDDTEKHRQRLTELWQVLEEEFGRWSYLDWEPVAVELSRDLMRPLPEDPHERQRVIDHLILCRRRLQLYLGRMLYTFNRLGLWRRAGFVSLGHYAQERLGLSTTTVHRLLARERQFLEHYRVFDRVWEGKLSVSQADALFPILSEIPDSCEEAWIAFATRTTTRNVEAVVKATCDLARADRETFLMSGYLPPPVDERPSQIRGRARRSDDALDIPALLGPIGVVVGWAASWIPTLTLRGRRPDPSVSLVVRVPDEILPLVEEAERVAAVYGAMTPSDALQMFLDGFISTWSKADLQMRAQTRRLMEAADYRCQVPGCTGRVDLEKHHLKFRSQGGGNEDANQAVTCKCHHHGGIHTGTIRAERRPDGAIQWELGIRNGKPYRAFHNETRINLSSLGKVH